MQGGAWGLEVEENEGILEINKSQEMWVQGQQDAEFILEHVEFKGTEDHLEEDTKKVMSLSTSWQNNLYK